jgi:hypothetical protein
VDRVIPVWMQPANQTSFTDSLANAHCPTNEHSITYGDQITSYRYPKANLYRNADIDQHQNTSTK